MTEYTITFTAPNQEYTTDFTVDRAEFDYLYTLAWKAADYRLQSLAKMQQQGLGTATTAQAMNERRRQQLAAERARQDTRRK